MRQFAVGDELSVARPARLDDTTDVHVHLRRRLAGRRARRAVHAKPSACRSSRLARSAARPRAWPVGRARRCSNATAKDGRHDRRRDASGSSGRWARAAGPTARRLATPRVEPRRRDRRAVRARQPHRQRRGRTPVGGSPGVRPRTRGSCPSPHVEELCALTRPRRRAARSTAGILDRPPGGPPPARFATPFETTAAPPSDVPSGEPPKQRPHSGRAPATRTICDIVSRVTGGASVMANRLCTRHLYHMGACSQIRSRFGLFRTSVLYATPANYRVPLDPDGRPGAISYQHNA